MDSPQRGQLTIQRHFLKKYGTKVKIKSFVVSPKQPQTKTIHTHFQGDVHMDGACILNHNIQRCPTANINPKTPSQQHTKTPKKPQNPPKTELLRQNIAAKTKGIYGIVVQLWLFAGQRARVPPDPIPNSEVKPCSVPSCSVVLGHVNLGKLATYFYSF